MSDSTHTTPGRAMTLLIRAVFRFNGALLNSGDALVADIGLTSAKWQVMGAIMSGDQPMPVAWIARTMGLSRQAVQRIVNDLIKAGLAETQPNPHHARAHLVFLTDAGKQRLGQATERQVEWVKSLTEDMTADEINAAVLLVRNATDNLNQRKPEGKSK